MQVITSRQNPLIKAIRALQRNKVRQREGRFLIEGVRLLEEALAAGLTLEKVLVCPDLIASERARTLVRRLEETGAALVAVTPPVLESVAETESPQGLLAVALCPSPPEPAIVLERTDLLVCGAGIQDPGNAGTLVRTAEAAGAGGIFFTGNAVYPFGSKVVRASMGSLFRLPAGMLPDDGQEFVGLCRKRRWEVVVTTPVGGIPFWQADFTRPVLVVLGNEGAGIPPELLELGTQRVFIPLSGPVESLNVAVAGGIILYEAVRQRRAGGMQAG